MGNYYSAGFASFFDSTYTGWVHRFSPRLAEHLTAETRLPHTALDLCCGTGITTSYLLDAGWRMFGVDGSKSMLDIARTRNHEAEEQGRLRLLVSDAREFTLPEQVSACFSLDGALNHLPSREELRRCFTAVRAALAPGGVFVFDLFEQSHFLHWNHVTVTDTPEAVVVKRGAWDSQARSGMLRVSGVYSGGGRSERVDQTLTSWYYDSDEVHATLREAGLEPVAHEFGGPDVKCDSGSCSRTSTPCRTIFKAVRR
jgi:SAM-dependent methyltransferase